MQYAVTKMNSPIGMLTLIGSAKGLSAVLWPHEVGFPQRFGPLAPDPQLSVLRTARQQLEEYFAGQRQRFDVPLDLVGTPFQVSVWNALRGITFGATASYGEIARQIGRPTAVRAVGAANGKNPVPIIVPCHRVIGADGTLTGFAGGLALKARLLAMERTAAPHRTGQLEFRHDTETSDRRSA